jgi:organic hydroperoxide reductase OsmC/OhrA
VAWECASLSSHFNQFSSRPMQKACEATPIAEQKTSAFVRQTGHLEKNADGKLAITRVELRRKITWGDGRKPSAEELDKMHHAAHENCFIANSVKTEVRVTKI